MPKDKWLRDKFIYYYFIEKGITPEQVDNMRYEDIELILLINHYNSEKQEQDRKRQEIKMRNRT